MIKIGINGFGRIGRAITRIISDTDGITVSVINDIDKDVKNLSYLLKYDSIYGRFNKNINYKNNNKISINKKDINFYSKKVIDEVPWSEHKLDLVIDSSGVENNVSNAKKILGNRLLKVLITHSPDKHVDHTLILGVNEKNYDYKKHNIISTSICDASALGPILNQLEKKYGIKSGYITTLHPRLSYQNLLDGSLKSVSNPGHSWKSFSLGRDSISNLIPKKTTAVKAVTKCLKGLEGKISGMSFRVPTSIVCASDITIKLKSKTTKENLSNHFKKLSMTNKDIFGYQEEPLVSIDHLGTSKSVIVDANFIDVIDSNLIKMVIWYDNEWGYSNRVVDIAKLALKRKK